MNSFVFVLVFVAFFVDRALANVNVSYLQTPDPDDLSLFPGELPSVGVQRHAALYINHRYQALRQRLIQHKHRLWIYHISQRKCVVKKNRTTGKVNLFSSLLLFLGRATRPNSWLQQRLFLLDGNTKIVYNEMKEKSRSEEENFSNKIKQIMINQLKQVNKIKKTLIAVLNLPDF